MRKHASAICRCRRVLSLSPTCRPPAVDMVAAVAVAVDFAVALPLSSRIPGKIKEIPNQLRRNARTARACSHVWCVCHAANTCNVCRAWQATSRSHSPWPACCTIRRTANTSSKLACFMYSPGSRALDVFALRIKHPTQHMCYRCAAFCNCRHLCC